MTKKLLIATPAFNGLVTIDYCFSMAKLLQECTNRALPTSIYVRHTGSLLIAERNKIINQFIKTDCTHLLCIDADIGFHAKDVFSMLDRNKDFIGAAYPSRMPGKSFIIRTLDQRPLVKRDDGLISLDCIPSGFMLLSKNCLERMMFNFPDLYFNSIDANEEGYAFFNPMVFRNEFWGEDFSFCIRAGQAGIEIFVDPSIVLNHAGTVGKLDDCLKGDS